MPIASFGGSAARDERMPSRKSPLFRPAAESIAGQSPKRLHNSNPRVLHCGEVRMIWTGPSLYRRPQREPAAAMMAAQAH